MTRWLREFRLIPIVLIAIGCLFALKTFGLVSDGGYTLGQRLGSGGALVVTTVPARAGDAMRSPAVPLEVASARRRAEVAPGCRRCSTIPATSPDRITTTKAAEKAAMEKAEAAAAERAAARAGAGEQGGRRNRDRAGPAAVGIGRASGRCWSACRSAGRSSTRARASSTCARACSRRRRRSSKSRRRWARPRRPKAAPERRGWARAQRKERGRERALQERRHHVRDHEAEGGGQDLRPARHQGADRGGEPDQAAGACPRSWRR